MKIAFLLFLLTSFFSFVLIFSEHNQDFICPLCMKKFNGPGELQSHFDQVHETQNDSSAVSNILLGEQ